ncbi:hypothetical protein [Halobacillus ihumii]|uniref:hypothetical protein n=1 Tax=Halobacillus ihumii TaxID=2686092 RepID=UPI0013D6972A|nr:hypothetical protein [Halobacillus ihumii]
MSEWLTTGQIIDRLKIGQIAESESGDLVEWAPQTGDLRFAPSGDKFRKNEHSRRMNKVYLNERWRIQPKYVSFGEAMIAHSKKKTVTYHHNDELRYRFEHSLDTGQFKELSSDNLCLHELIEGKWTIEE